MWQKVFMQLHSSDTAMLSLQQNKTFVRLEKQMFDIFTG